MLPMCWKAPLDLWPSQTNGGNAAVMWNGPVKMMRSALFMPKKSTPFVILVAMLGLAGCAPPVPESGAGVGFTDYNGYPAQSVEPAPPVGFDPAAAAAAIDRSQGVSAPLNAIPVPLAPSQVAVDPSRTRGDAPSGIKAEGGEMGYVVAGVSDEQDFNAVSARETIESDKARIERNRATYTIDQPTALPERRGDVGPNIVEYALATSHPIGTQMFRRSSILLANPQKACAKFASPDLAQEAFLAAGGPDRDRKTLDPDGDGYACFWDPAPFRAALQ
jgi:hypothetical protein